MFLKGTKEPLGFSLVSMSVEAAFEDMRQYFLKINRRLRKVYLFCEEDNEEGRGFYKSQGFRLEVVLKDFWEDGNAVMYSQVLKF